MVSEHYASACVLARESSAWSAATPPGSYLKRNGNSSPSPFYNIKPGWSCTPATPWLSRLEDVTCRISLHIAKIPGATF